MSANNTNHQKSLTASVEVCLCGHGKVHHDGEYGDCTCPISSKNSKCSCNEFIIDYVILNGSRLNREQYEKLLENAYAENEEH